MAEATVDQSAQTVYRVKTVFGGSKEDQHDLVRATTKQRASWWAKERYDQGWIAWAMPVDPQEVDTDEIVDVGGWDFANL